MKWIFLFFFSGIIVFAATLFFRLGGHKPVQLSQVSSQTSFLLLYKPHIGPYHQINATINEVEVWAAEKHLPCSQTFGLFLDNPEKVEPERLRSLAGCLLPLSSQQVIKKLMPSQEPDFSQTPKIAWTFWKFPAALKASFRGSPSIGPFKVYPKAQKWFQKHRLPYPKEVLEVYTLFSSSSIKTEYYFPLPVN
ncbi:MAG: hypothetical protein D6797_01310 [Bdellovibrio sp.]|nr:MAG: hypothetical protein D6797_01310 [Bdellovibrio sp.]